MTNLILVTNIISLLNINLNVNANFKKVLDSAIPNNKLVASANNINDWNDYLSYTETTNDSNSSKNKDKYTAGIENVKNHLQENYPEYRWVREDEKCRLTSDITTSIPLEMRTKKIYSDSEFRAAIRRANVGNYTTYGGCGPIAMVGILDYFARYLGYSEIINDPTDSGQRIDLITEVLKNTDFSLLGSDDETLVWPSDFVSCFNTIINNYGLNNIIHANAKYTLFDGNKEAFWNDVISSIDNGIPVTMFVGAVANKDVFSKHYTNIYGYENWIGISNESNQKLQKAFLKARVNIGKDDGYYCDSDIFNNLQVGIITYEINYSNNYTFNDYDFSNYFVNSSGGGQYYFTEKDAQVVLNNDYVLETKRLRTSYIENEFLVLSPGRKNAGTAFLDITFPHNFSKFSFTASLWSDKEGINDETFKLQIIENGDWKDYFVADLSKLSYLKEYPNQFNFLFPKQTNRIRFYANYYNPQSSKNRGRICLDNFNVSFNY